VNYCTTEISFCGGGLVWWWGGGVVGQKKVTYSYVEMGDHLQAASLILLLHV